MVFTFGKWMPLSTMLVLSSTSYSPFSNFIISSSVVLASILECSVRMHKFGMMSKICFFA